MSLPKHYSNHGFQWHVDSSLNRVLFPQRLANVDSSSADSPKRIVKVIPSKMLSSVLIILGAITLLISIIYSSSILALIGLGLLFFGIIFTYFSSEEYVKKVLLDTTVSSQQATLGSFIAKLGYEGSVVYLPPKYLRNPEFPQAYLSRQRKASLPKLEQLERDEQGFLVEKNPDLLLVPPGAELSKLFEKTLGTNFISVDLQYLQQNLPKLFIEDLELAQDFEVQVEGDVIRVEIQDSVYSVAEAETEEPSRLHSVLGSPLSSALACALAKATNKPIVIEKEQASKNGKDVTIEFRTLEERSS